MSTSSAARPLSSSDQQAAGFERFAGLCAIMAALAGFFYSLAFVFLKIALLPPLFLMLGGLLAIPALSALYSRVRAVESSVALLAWALGIVGALGALIHGGFDLANVINPPAIGLNLANLPSSIDPRGLLTFGVAGLGFFGFAWLIGRASQFPRVMSYLAYLLAVLLIVLYLGRLIILDPKNPFILVTGALSGFIVNPVWYLWLGMVLWSRNKKTV